MFSLFGKKKNTSVSAPAPPACPVGDESSRSVPMLKTGANGRNVFDTEVFGKLNSCYQKLKAEKASDKRLNDLFDLIDRTRQTREAELTRNVPATPADEEKVRRDEDTILKVIKELSILTKSEKAIASQYVTGFRLHFKHFTHEKARQNAKTRRNVNRANRLAERANAKTLRNASHAVRNAERVLARTARAAATAANTAALNRELNALVAAASSSHSGGRRGRRGRRTRRRTHKRGRV